MQYENPVIKGFYPDPSICKHEDTYYLVCSTFNYFPGVPLFESKDLVNWDLIGYTLSRESQLELAGTGNAGGIYAPTIRCHNGRFYMVTTHVSHSHFYVWTDDIYGEWSEPIWVDQEGIDPSLYFEDDKVYFMSNGNDTEGNAAVLQCEIDVATGKKITETQFIWSGSGGRYLEAPHLYKINDTYYIIASEGGTEYGHMVIYAKGETPYGPFEQYPSNPVLTNRDLGGYQLQGAGHADLIEDNDGNWWMVHLAFRQLSRYEMHHILGREVCLVPVTFDEDGWFSVDGGITTKMIVETDKISDAVIQKPLPIYTFDGPSWSKEWTFLRNPKMENYEIEDGMLKLKATDVKLTDSVNSPSFIALRQRELHGSIEVKVKVTEQEAGLTFYMNDHHHYDFAVVKSPSCTKIIKRRCVGDIEFIQEQQVIASDEVVLQVVFDNQAYRLQAIVDGETVDFGSCHARYLSKETADGFTGVVMGLYAQGMHDSKDFSAEFSSFKCSYPPVVHE